VRLQGGAEQEELFLPAQGKGGEGSDQAGDGLGPGASVGLNKRVRVEGRAGSHKPPWAMGSTAKPVAADWAYAAHCGGRG
jgi:hypothetical protein